ncbi:MAG: hypothetical protein ACD_7C00281G0001 [uncultured bacterium]|nr:MAG: hypothetical protein ACD_7C00281G0001 [uncultured bacterium]
MTENMERCPRFHTCSRNFCPLDFDLHLRSGNKSDKCRFNREAKQTRIGQRHFISGGTQMPDALLNFVPESNLASLNKSSQERWLKLNC